MSSPFLQTVAPSLIQQVHFVNDSGHQQNLWIKRDDLIDANISGNKWRKLKYNIVYAIESGACGIASFGGAFSNHIAALAAAGCRANIATIGFIRCHQIDDHNPTLQLAKKFGMRLIALSRQEYQQRNQAEFLTELAEQYPNYFFVPEGGSNAFAHQGLHELAEEIQQQGQFDVIASALGSAGTVQGLMKAMPAQQFIGVPVVKDLTLLAQLKQQGAAQLTLDMNSFFGGYGKITNQLEDFCLEFYRQTQVPIEPVYTGKMLYALCHHQEQLGITANTKVLAIHTGGLQGINGLIYRQQVQQSRWQALATPVAL